MSYWINYEMLKAEINLLRNNAQRIIKSYKEQGKSFPDGNSTRKDIIDRLEYQEAIGKEVELAVLERWCEDFKFSMNDLMTKEEQP